jgi:putative SOS response-associated peptidase YedK
VFRGPAFDGPRSTAGVGGLDRVADRPRRRCVDEAFFMCSRYSLTSPAEAVRAYFAARGDHAFPPRYNIAPTQPILVARRSERGDRELVLVRWGLIPGWVKDPRTFSTLINARSESVLEKPSFRASVRHRRCLVPADGFYEWLGPAGAKRPHLFRPRSGGLLAFAGLWEHWLGADGSELETAAILTVPANATVAPIHDRMPAIVPPEHISAWLDCREVKADLAVALLGPAPASLLEVVEVDPRLNNVRNEGPELQRPPIGKLV